MANCKILSRSEAAYFPIIHDLTSQQNASFAISEDKNIVLGLPPPNEGTWHTFRSYSLTETLVDCTLKVIKSFPFLLFLISANV